MEISYEKESTLEIHNYDSSVKYRKNIILHFVRGS